MNRKYLFFFFGIVLMYIQAEAQSAGDLVEKIKTKTKHGETEVKVKNQDNTKTKTRTDKHGNVKVIH